MEPVTVLTFNEPEHAQPIKERLEAAGVVAAIYDERKLQKFWYISDPLGGIRLRVDRKDYERAQDLLREWHKTDGMLREAIHCPDCGSSRVEYPQFTRKFLLPNLVGLASLLHIIDKEFFCQECEYTWPKDIKAQWPPRYGAPYYFIEDIPPASGARAPEP